MEMERMLYLGTDNGGCNLNYKVHLGKSPLKFSITHPCLLTIVFIIIIDCAIGNLHYNIQYKAPYFKKNRVTLKPSNFVHHKIQETQYLSLNLYVGGHITSLPLKNPSTSAQAHDTHLANTCMYHLRPPQPLFHV